jgi:excisionase family DNA binding protein
LTQPKSIEQIIEEIVIRKIDERLSDRFMSLNEVNEEFGCSRTWVYRQHANGHLNLYKLGGKTRIKRSEVEALAVSV